MANWYSFLRENLCMSLKMKDVNHTISRKGWGEEEGGGELTILTLAISQDFE
jgi:hypothetical protein